MKDNYIESRKQEVVDFLKDERFKDYEIDYILFNPDTKNIVMSASGKDDSSLELILNKDDKGDFICKRAADWEFSIYEYVFSYLDRDFEIVEMKMPVHYMAWKELAESYSDDYYFKGVQKYLQYCKDNELTKEVVEKDFDEKLEDIMTFYYDRKKLFIIGDEKVEMSREIFDKRCNRFYWTYVLGQELSNNLLSKYEKQPYDVTYDFCYHMANEFIEDKEITEDTFNSIEILQEWIKESEEYIINTYENYIDKKSKEEEMER